MNFCLFKNVIHNKIRCSEGTMSRNIHFLYFFSSVVLLLSHGSQFTLLLSYRERESLHMFLRFRIFAIKSFRQCTMQWNYYSWILVMLFAKSRPHRSHRPQRRRRKKNGKSKCYDYFLLGVWCENRLIIDLSLWKFTKFIWMLKTLRHLLIHTPNSCVHIKCHECFNCEFQQIKLNMRSFRTYIRMLPLI